MGPIAREKSGFKEGDKVMALIGGGGYAGTENPKHITLHHIEVVFVVLEYCTAPYQVVMRAPGGVNMTEAAGLRKYSR